MRELALTLHKAIRLPMRQISIVLISMLCCATSLQAQEFTGNIGLAEEAKADEDYYGAMIYYAKAYAIDSTEQELTYNYALAARNAKQYDLAERLFKRVYSKGRGRFYPDGPLQIAELLTYQGQYLDAIQYYKRAARIQSLDEEQQRRVEQGLSSCAFAVSNPLIDEDVTINILEVSKSNDSEFAVALQLDSAVLYSAERGTYNARGVLRNDEAQRVSLFRLPIFSAEDQSTKPFPIPGTETAYHVANPAYTTDGGTLYFTQTDTTGKSAIYRWEFWENPLPELVLPQLDAYKADSYSQPYPYTYEGKQYLLYSSDASGGKGGLDIWRMNLDGNSSPEPLAMLNTPGNDVCPSYDPVTETIYYSSDGLDGYGDYDIYAYPADLNPDASSKNLGLPINSAHRDLYYRPGKAHSYLSSDRPGEGDQFCCSNIYQIDAGQGQDARITDVTAIEDLPDRISNVSELNGLLPIALYFHNDMPDPGSGSSATSATYGDTYATYLPMREEYAQRYAQGFSGMVADSIRQEMGSFFDSKVAREYRELEAVLPLILQELEAGKRIEIAIKGYASPLAKNDYNQKLTARRIASVINHMEESLSGKLKPYMQGGSPALSIQAIPFGEEESATRVSDNPLDQKNSVYSLAAARERRVEILRIEEAE